MLPLTTTTGICPVRDDCWSFLRTSKPVPPGIPMSSAITSGGGAFIANMSACMASWATSTCQPLLLSPAVTRRVRTRSSSAMSTFIV